MWGAGLREVAQAAMNRRHGIDTLPSIDRSELACHLDHGSPETRTGEEALRRLVLLRGGEHYARHSHLRERRERSVEE